MRARRWRERGIRGAVRALPLVLVLAPAAPARAEPGCIVNRTGTPLLLVVDDLDGRRVSRVVAGREPLCLDIPPGRGGKTLVGVFADETAIEGCSRLSAPGRTEILGAFAAFDNCRWLSETPGD